MVLSVSSDLDSKGIKNNTIIGVTFLILLSCFSKNLNLVFFLEKY